MNLSPTHPDLLETMNDLAYAYHGTHNLPAAEKLFIELLELAGRIYDNDHILKALYKCNYAGCLAAKQEYKRAIALFDEGLPVFNKVSPKHAFTLQFRNSEAATFYKDGQYKVAKTKFKDLIPPVSQIQGPTSTELQEVMADAALSALQDKDTPPAIDQLKKLATIAIDTNNMDGTILLETLREMQDILKKDSRSGEYQAIADAIAGFIRASNPKFEKLALSIDKTKQ